MLLYLALVTAPRVSSLVSPSYRRRATFNPRCRELSSFAVDLCWIGVVVPANELQPPVHCLFDVASSRGLEQGRLYDKSLLIR
jgi:hypothetical protein